MNIHLNYIRDNSRASQILDITRFLAAMVVFLFHFYVPLPGYQAVMVFFVLSGYFISSSVLRAINQRRWSWPDYLINRITRLWIVLVPCLILTFFWGTVQVNLFGYHKLVESLDWKSFIGNVFFTQKILVDPYGMNGPLWSLTYEFWYYILFPCLVLIIVAKKKSTKVINAMLFILISLFVGQHIMLYFLIWLLGALIPFIKKITIKNKLVVTTLMIISSVILVRSLMYPASSATFLLDFRVGLACALFIYCIVSFYNDIQVIHKFNLAKHLASFSFTLYLAHYPLANIILTWLVSPLWPFEETSILIKIILATLVLTYAWGLALLTERHTDTLRKIVKNRMLNQKIIKKNYLEV